MGWQMPPLNTRCQLFASPGNFLAIFYCCFICATKERSPESLVELNRGLCDLSPGQTMPTFIPTNTNNIGHCWPLLDVGWPNEPKISTQHLSAFHSNSINNNNTGSTTLLIGSEYASPPPAYLFKKNFPTPALTWGPAY